MTGFPAARFKLFDRGLLRLAGDWTDDAFARRRGVAAMVSLLAWLTAG